MPHLLLLVLCCLSGFALLLPLSPQWAVHGGADEFGAGLVTATLMAATVLAQLLVKTALDRLGWARTLALGALLLGLPAPVQALDDSLWTILLTTALRGLGFGIITVCGSTAAATLAPPGRRGAAVGLYGLALTLPQVVLTPAAPALASALALPAILACGVLPVLGLPFARGLGRAVDARTTASATEHAVEGAAPATTVLRRILLPLLTLLLVTAAGGAVLTFAPQLLDRPALAALALFLFTATGAGARWGAGVLADRLPLRPLTCALLVTAATGLALVALAVRSDRPLLVLLLAGLVLLGAGYGGLQSLTFVQSFDRAGAENRHTTSVAWNIGYDSGTGIGSLLLGLAAHVATFSAGFVLLSGAMTLVAVVVLALGGRPRAAPVAGETDAAEHGPRPSFSDH
ncbi:MULTISPECIES: MFS transporter [unclassified Streptomyces]|uniref:MFS transporter n=1 Tax=unclassified Streptomyces TaxID=2593676 RepID=UPI001CB6BE39|nr:MULTISPECIES: MFS transporter [unclassified Streptomyces]MBD0711844.1 MFS transporter [Streptomyces sp. CBMA291]MBD0714664.1 MFS transporter [Streptomyces sp. CBMA370]